MWAIARSAAPQIAIAVGALLLAWGTASAQTRFGGLTVDDTPTMIEAAAKKAGWRVKWRDALFQSDDEFRVAELFHGEILDASIVFSKTEKLTSLTLFPSFYGGEGMSVREAAKLLVDQFGGQAEPHFIEKPAICPQERVFYKGALTNGERFEVMSQPVSWTECGAVIALYPRSGKKPGF